MAKKEKNKEPECKKNEEAPEVTEQPIEENQAPEKQAPEKQAPEKQAPEKQEPTETEKLQKQLNNEHEAHLRLAAEYDNFRKRSQKEREAIYTEVRAQTVGKFLPVYDNLQRALENETADTAYKKGVELTMNELWKILQGLGVEVFGEQGDKFDPAMHNAVMHIEDEQLGEGVLAEVFQKGFRIGEKVIRFAMVKVAN